MSVEKRIKRVVHSQLINMGGILLHQPIPAVGLDQVDPFLLIHYGSMDQEGGKRSNEAGVGPHPHRGFSPVSFIFKGSIEHRDSRGNRQIIGAGGTQWINSGMGIIHSERPPKELAEVGGEMEMMQIWVNTPAANKMDEPEYFPLPASETPVIEKDGMHIAIVSGEYEGKQSPIPQKSPLLMLRIEMKADSEGSIDIPKGFNSLLFTQEDGLEVLSQDLGEREMAVFSEEGDRITLSAKNDIRFVVLAGEPLNEEVTKSGPFVMNTQTEVMEAMRDYQMGKMGVLIEEFGN